jgi:hypothetical protein
MRSYRMTLFMGMPAYVKTNTKVGAQEVIWSESSSDYDLSGRWISIPDARIGHIHFHINRRVQRVQAWVLERRSWEEYNINFYSLGDHIGFEELLKQDVHPWNYFVRTARNLAAV